MSEKEEVGSAFPCEGSGALYPDPGMSLRDYFAGQALVGVVSNPRDYSEVTDAISAASFAYEVADAMLEARK